MNKLKLVNERLRKHDMCILFDGTHYQAQGIGVRSFSADYNPYHYRSIQSCLDFITPIIKHNVTEYSAQ